MAFRHRGSYRRRSRGRSFSSKRRRFGGRRRGMAGRQRSRGVGVRGGIRM